MSYQNLFNLSDKVVLITGAAGGLGQAMAIGLAEYGADIALADLKPENTNDILAQIHGLGRKAAAFKVDITDKDDVRLMVEKVHKEFGKIDVLVNSAGINNRKKLEDYTEQEWDNIVDVNLKGTFLCSQAVGEIMLAQGKGKIINLASVSSVLGHPHHAPYAASKGGVALLTKVMAVEWAKRGINVNAIAPAYVRTSLTADHLAEGDNYQQISNTIPMGRLGEPEDIVGAAVYLASNASNFVTGHLLMVDGGRCAD
ncbi:glucose 1-dehydrogenase [Metallumcola ferriviriculae]|uniref:Glucose 1-dehydrogenase n=1 Tax=Metallumcola ferriviriculae TaxID=3039180 RepID=A0AAU0UQY0_9FIRM|nr:glucose 1-dehydrogenase [Desulfitibacteraceae bacterium MK1]